MIVRQFAPTIIVLAIINPRLWLIHSIGLVARALRTLLVIAPIVL